MYYGRVKRLAGNEIELGMKIPTIESRAVTRYVPGTPETVPMSEYHRPIYESLPIDHFKTPCHVHDLFRDSKQHSVTKPYNSYNTISSTNVKRADPMGSKIM